MGKRIRFADTAPLTTNGLAVCVWGCECGRGRFWWWAGASCWSAQLFLCVLGSGLAAVGQVVAVTGGLNPIVLRHRASQ
jgi:hypothetical protein